MTKVRDAWCSSVLVLVLTVQYVEYEAKYEAASRRRHGVQSEVGVCELHSDGLSPHRTVRLQVLGCDDASCAKRPASHDVQLFKRFLF